MFRCSLKKEIKTMTAWKEYCKTGKLKSRLSLEHRCKNLKQNIIKSKAMICKKNDTSRSSEVCCRNASVAEHLINQST